MTVIARDWKRRRRLTPRIDDHVVVAEEVGFAAKMISGSSLSPAFMDDWEDDDDPSGWDIKSKPNQLKGSINAF